MTANRAWAVQIAMNFVPTRQSFMNALGNSETIQEDMQMFVDNFGSILKQLYDWLVRHSPWLHKCKCC